MITDNVLTEKHVTEIGIRHLLGAFDISVTGCSGTGLGGWGRPVARWCWTGRMLNGPWNQRQLCPCLTMSAHETLQLEMVNSFFFKFKLRLLNLNFIRTSFRRWKWAWSFSMSSKWHPVVGWWSCPACSRIFSNYGNAKKTTTTMYYLLNALPIITRWKQWTTFDLRSEYQTYANRIQTVKPKFENSNSCNIPCCNIYQSRQSQQRCQHFISVSLLKTCIKEKMWISITNLAILVTDLFLNCMCV